MTWMVGVIGVLIAFINVFYGISKDNVQKGEAEIRECIETLKRALQDILDHKSNNYKSHITYIESLIYLRLVKENNIEKTITRFAGHISDFHENSISEEDLIGSYKTAIESVYNMKFSVCKYLFYIVKPKNLRIS